MAVSEVNSVGQAGNPSGVYRHPDTGEELVTQATAKFGNPQADAITRLGFVYVGPAKLEVANANGKPGTVVAPIDPGAAPLADTSPTLRSVAELESDLRSAKEREAAANKAGNAKSNLVDQATVDAQLEAEADAGAEKGDK